MCLDRVQTPCALTGQRLQAVQSPSATLPAVRAICGEQERRACRNSFQLRAHLRPACVGVQLHCGHPVVAGRPRVSEDLVHGEAGLALQRILHTAPAHQPARRPTHIVTHGRQLMMHAGPPLTCVLPHVMSPQETAPADERGRSQCLWLIRSVLHEHRRVLRLGRAAWHKTGKVLRRGLRGDLLQSQRRNGSWLRQHWLQRQLPQWQGLPRQGVLFAHCLVAIITGIVSTASMTG